jgi:DNA-binding response OmpR family regulator
MNLTPRPRTSTIALVGYHMTSEPDEVFDHMPVETRVLRFATGGDAIRIAQSENICDWYIDSVLPDGSGFDCIEMLQDLNPSARYFLFSEKYRAEDERRAFQLARTRYFTRPLTQALVAQLSGSESMRVSQTLEADSHSKT